MYAVQRMLSAAAATKFGQLDAAKPAGAPPPAAQCFECVLTMVIAEKRWSSWFVASSSPCSAPLWWWEGGVEMRA